MSTTHNAVLDELVSALDQLRLSRYLCIAAFVLSLYDGILLLGDEYMTIWRTRWTLPKSIYYFNRVVTPIGLGLATFRMCIAMISGFLLNCFRSLGSPNVGASTKIVSIGIKILTNLHKCLLEASCILYIFINSLTELFSFFLSNLLLTLRLVALYKRRRWVSWFLYGFLTLSYAAAAVLMVVALREYGLGVSYSTIFHACSSQTRSPLMPVIFMVPLAFEFTLFFLTGLRAWQDAKIVAHSSNAPFLHVLYRDGIVCFFVMFGVRIWNIWIYATQPIASAYQGIYLFWAVMTILYTRVYLNLVFLAHRPSFERTEVSNVKFAPMSHWGGVNMRVETTTLGDSGEVVTFEGGRIAMPLMTFESNSGIDATIAHAKSTSAWNDRAGKSDIVSSAPMERDYPRRSISS